MSEKDYQVVKLSNGENLICDVISDSDTTLNSQITTQDGNTIKIYKKWCCRITISCKMDATHIVTTINLL